MMKRDPSLPPPKPVTLPCPTCRKDVPTQLVHSRRTLGPGAWVEDIKREVVEHACMGSQKERT